MTVVVDSSRIVLVGDRHSQASMESACERLPVVGIVGTDCASAAAEPFPDVDAALHSTKADTICMLSPKHAAFQSIHRIVSAGVHVLCAGPLLATATQCSQLQEQAQQYGIRIRLGGRERHQPRMKKLHQLRASDAFGEPVYARCVAGGGTTLDTAWWSMCELLAVATWLLRSSPVRMVVGATRRGRARLHVTVTVAMHNRANAQLCIAPGRDGTLADTWLLGSGGTISSRCENGDIVIARPDQRHLLDANGTGPEMEWITDFITDEEVGLQAEASTLDAGRRLLPAMRRALKESRLCVA